MVMKKGTDVRLDVTRWLHMMSLEDPVREGIVLALTAPNSWLVCCTTKAIMMTPCPLRADEPLLLYTFIRLMMGSRRKVYDIFRGEETRSIFSCRGVEGWPEGSQAK